MKKLISLMLALMLVFSLATVAMGTTQVTPDGQYTAQITKTYTTTAGAVPATLPGETLTFTVTAADANPDKSKLITIGTNNSCTVSTASNTNTIDITLPTYDKVGVYNYTVSENAPTPVTQGVTYTNTTFGVQVVVYYETVTKEEGDKEVSVQEMKVDMSFTSDGDNNQKIDSFTNNYDLGSLTVKKEIEGNLASADQYFDFVVNLTAAGKVMTDITISGGSHPSNSTSISATNTVDGVTTTGWTGTKTINLKLKGDETVTFSNVPEGVTYTVNEAASHAAADANGSDTSKGYTVTCTGGDSIDETKKTISGTINADTTDATVIKNTKSTNITTGVITESAPYVLLIAICAVAAVAFVIKRRNSVEF